MRLTRIAVVALLGIVLVSTVACGSGGSSGLTYCSDGCLISLMGDGTCDDACNNAACSYDSGDCTECAPDCPQSWVGNGYCNYKCNNAACSYDGGDCSYSQPTKQPTATQQSGYCSANCMWSWVGDGECDSSLGCNVAACNYDGGDCNSQSNYCAAGCPYSWVGDGYCDGTCNNYACNYDGGDCDISECDAGYSLAVNDDSICCPSGYPYYWSTDGNCHTAPWLAPTLAPGCPSGYSQAVNNPSKCCADGYPYYWDSDGMCHTVAPPAWREDLRSGDLVYDPNGNWGFTGHIGICYGTGYIIEAISSGVTKTPIEEWDNKPELYVLRVDCSDYTAAQAAGLALTQVGKPYDIAWIQKSSDLNSEYWYCSELVWAVYMNVGINLYNYEGPVAPFDFFSSTQVIYHK